MADACGFFADEGLEVELHRELGWANIRDKLVFGRLDAAHALIGLSVQAAIDAASAASGPRTTQGPRAILALGRGGDAITLSRRLADAGVTSGAGLAQFIRAMPRSLPRLTLAYVSDVSVHHYILRDWLDRAGIDPDRDVLLKAFPPPQMANLLAAGHIDGFCAGEPWNLLAQERGGGRIVALTTDQFPNHPDKVVAANPRWLERSPEAAAALIRGVMRGAAFCADTTKIEQVASILARSEYLDVPHDTILRSLRLDRRFNVPANLGDVRSRDWVMRSFDAATPSVEDAAWLIRLMQHWSHADASLDATSIAAHAVDAGPFRHANSATSAATSQLLNSPRTADPAIAD